MSAGEQVDVAPSGELDCNKTSSAAGSGSHQDQVVGKQQEDQHHYHHQDSSGTLDGSAAMAFSSGGSTARPNPRLMAALANMVVEDFGNTLKSSLRLTAASASGEQKPKRSGLAGLLGDHQGQLGSSKLSSVVLGGGEQQLNSVAEGEPAPAQPRQQQFCEIELGNDQQQQQQQQQTPKESLGRAAFRRTQLGLLNMNSLSSTTGHAIADELAAQFEADLRASAAAAAAAATANGNNSSGNNISAGTLKSGPLDRPPMMLMSTLNSQSSLAKSPSQQQQPASVAGTLQRRAQQQAASVALAAQQVAAADEAAAAASSKKAAEDLQLVLLKIIVKRDKNILKYLLVFTILGALLFMHIMYFFMHVEKLCREKGYDFSSVAGTLLAAQATSEIFAFIIVTRYYMPKVGRTGSFVSVALCFAIRYAFYATYYSQMSPYWAILTESCHGIAYGIVYTLVTDIGRESVNQLDLFIPELIELGIIDSRINPMHLKLPLRATMQGVFSGAFDGFGNGLGALFAGVYLDYKYSYESLWMLCTAIALGLAIVYPLSEWRRSSVDSPGDTGNSNNEKPLALELDVRKISHEQTTTTTTTTLGLANSQSQAA